MSHIVVFQGDSITDGNRTKDSRNFWDLNHYLGHGYAQMVAARLRRPGIRILEKLLI